MVKNPSAMWETWVLSLGWEDPLEKGKATHSSILAWRIPRTGYSPLGPKELDTTERLSLSGIKIVKTVYNKSQACFQGKILLPVNMYMSTIGLITCVQRN